MDETNEILRQILGVLERVPDVSQDGTATGKPSREVVGTPSAKQLAIDWLKSHPEHRKKSTRWLEENVQPMGVQIGKSTWSRAKK